MTIIDLIERKRDGGALSTSEIQWVLTRFTRDEIPDYQMAALLMAVLWRGLDGAELDAWTEAMLTSGDVLDLSHISAPKVDKHSTGGVGDKVSIVLGPMVAACGVVVPMMSGRGLGHTGGTVDKLESIPGFVTALEPDRFRSQAERLGLVLAGQSETLVPADRRIYALRDATGTVPSIPLIASSIMSKKLAEDLDALVLDVKVGSAAFMKDLDDARSLARTMVDIGNRNGTRTTALLTEMSQPLGRAVGNANEIVESVDMLKGGGPPDLVEIVYRLGAEMLVLAGVTSRADEARVLLERSISEGEALAKLAEVVAAQGGDPAALEDPSLLPRATDHTELAAPAAGWVTKCDALEIGRAAVRLGAGRERKEDVIDPGVGFEILAKVGDRVEQGQPLVRIAWSHPDKLDAALELLPRAWTVAERPPAAPRQIIEEVR